jgi:hypothetical protein
MTTRQSLENMRRIEVDTLNWQRANDESYAAIMATMQRILDLNEKIEATTGMRSSAYAKPQARPEGKQERIHALYRLRSCR